MKDSNKRRYDKLNPYLREKAREQLAQTRTIFQSKSEQWKCLKRDRQAGFDKRFVKGINIFRDRHGLYGEQGLEINMSRDQRVRDGQIEGIKKIKQCSELVKKCQKQIDNPRAKADLKGINQFLKADHNQQIAE